MKKHKHLSLDTFRIAIYYTIIALVMVFIENMLFGFSFSTPLFIWLSKNKLLMFFITSVILIYYFSSAEIRKKNLAISQLRDQEEKYLQLFNNANDAIILLSGDIIIDCNTKTFELLKRNRFQVINKSITSFSAVYQTSGENSYKKYWKIIDSDEIDGGGIYWLFLSPDGDIIDASITVTQIEILNKPYVQLIAKDISKRIKDKIQIKESERKFKEIVENANSVIVKFDLQGEITFINEFGIRVFGYQMDEIIGRCIFDVFKKNPKVHKYTKDETRRLMRRVLKNIAIEPNQEHWNYTKSGKKVFISWTSKPIYDLKRNLIGVLSIGADQTENKIVHDRLLKSQQKFRAVFNEITEGITILNHKGQIIEQNEAALAFLGFDRSDLNDHKNTSNKLKSIVPNLDELLCAVKEKGEIQFEMDISSANKGVVRVDLVARVTQLGNQPVVLVVSRDITERKNQQQYIFNVALQAEEMERSRVAKELHDSVSPMLSASKLYAQTLQDAKTEELKDQIIEKIESSIDETIRSIYEISNNLSPHILENFGLTEAVNSFIEKVPVNKVNISFSSNFKSRLDNKIEITLYRVVTELINNSLKHARAKNVILSINKNSDHISLSYNDDGVGFDKKQVFSTSKGMGVFNITNRINSINGKMDIKTKPQKGLDIQVWLPLN